MFSQGKMKKRIMMMMMMMQRVAPMLEKIGFLLVLSREESDSTLGAKCDFSFCTSGSLTSLVVCTSDFCIITIVVCWIGGHGGRLAQAFCIE
jgi:hypothetical protein